MSQAQNTKKRVAAYLRVAASSDGLTNHFELQTEYYTRHIQANGAWEFAELYTDEGVSGNTTEREGLQRMLRDALDGKIDIIITKSISRFSRNTVDTVIILRQLKENGVEVFFEKENISTMGSNCELFFNIMSLFADEENGSERKDDE